MTQAKTPSFQLLLTGVTGFVGKVILESLLRQREQLGLECIYVLIRKKGRNAQQRFEQEVAASPCFSELPDHWESYVHVLAGDLGTQDLSLDKAQQTEIQPQITHIINCAASIEFDLPLIEAAKANISTALNLLEFARDCEQLISCVSLSTAYVTPHAGQDVLVTENLVPLPFNVLEVYQSILAGNADEAALLAQTGHPNTYTFTKCLSEHLLQQSKQSIPLAIIRPSIISASWRYPKVGWIDSYAAFAAFVALSGAGALKTIVAHEETVLDLIPCDVVAERAIATVFGKRVGEPAFIQHVTAGIHQGCRIDMCLAGVESYFQRNPIHAWPSHIHLSNGVDNQFRHWLYHRLPTQVAAAYFTAFGKKLQRRQLKNVQSRIEYLNKAFPYFTLNSFSFVSAQPIGFSDFDPKQYIETVCHGIYHYLQHNNERQMLLAGNKQHSPRNDLMWALQQPRGNWAIRFSAYWLKKGMRQCTDKISFNRPSFKHALQQVQPNGLLILVPSHRSYMDFILCSYLFFSHAELNVAIPQVAASDAFAKIPLLAWFFKQSSAFYINRARRCGHLLLQEKVQHLAEQQQTLEFFIEGTRSRSRQFLKPKQGLLRLLQQTNVTCTILPIAISYDRIPEELAFMKELQGAEKPTMTWGALLKWTRLLLAGKVDLGCIHIECGEAIQLDAEQNLGQVSHAIMAELQAKTVVSSFHLQTFLAAHPDLGLDFGWLKNAILQRGGLVIDSTLVKQETMTGLAERSLRYQWVHHFYPDILALFPEHPVILRHLKENAYSMKLKLKPLEPCSENTKLYTLLRALFKPMMDDYRQILSIISLKKGLVEMVGAKSIVIEHPSCFLPIVEELLLELQARDLLQPNAQKSAYEAGRNWQDLAAFTQACLWLEKSNEGILCY